MNQARMSAARADEYDAQAAQAFREGRVRDGLGLALKSKLTDISGFGQAVTSPLTGTMDFGGAILRRGDPFLPNERDMFDTDFVLNIATLRFGVRLGGPGVIAEGAAADRLATGSSVLRPGELVVGDVEAGTAAPMSSVGTLDESLTLYHGSSVEGAASIRNSGIDLSKGFKGADFGRGFYMTTSKDEAVLSASRLYGAENVDVVEYQVLRSDLDSLTRLDLGSNANAGDWADMVRFHKTYGPAEDLFHFGDPYDIVEGPLFGHFSRNGAPVINGARGPQISIHTPEAVSIFDRSVVK